MVAPKHQGTPKLLKLPFLSTMIQKRGVFFVVHILSSDVYVKYHRNRGHWGAVAPCGAAAKPSHRADRTKACSSGAHVLTRQA